ncbi:MAG: hypothetical protein KC464_30220 [Myxococcales bacterium]|nr:hypothetical protein [Myxococcales bacterium]
MRQDRYILVVHGDRKTQRTVHRILGATFCPVQVVDTVAAAEPRIAARAPFLLVIDHEQLVTPAGRALVRQRGAAPCLVLMQDAEAGEVPGVLGVDHLSYLMANPMPLLAEEMIATALKLLRADLFGLEKYLGWGVEVRERTLTDAAQRVDAVTELSDDIHAVGLGPRVAAAASLIADELLSNALHNAPIDAAGGRPHADRSRPEGRPLVGRDQVTLRYACDARYLAVEVGDRWGTLDRATIMACLTKAVSRSPNKVSMTTAGAGIGLATVYGTCNHLVFNLQPGARTEVIALIDVRFRPAELANAVCSFGVFAT